MINQVEDSAQVVGCKNQSNISCGAFYGFRCHDIIKIPLPLYYSLAKSGTGCRMFDDGLSSAVYFIIILDSDFILINKIGILEAFNESAFGIFGAFFKSSQLRQALDL
ncbi:hypothetical protein [Flavobacterium sp. GSP6]|uniref:hypothetical protein n=1 Tax=Flavobacterium sp. GSP6 TaxID=2497488 RepID=UPI000F865DCD|nr:hypothetical protein [Flavobacterium sp. GSP6]RTZ04287.1 hypothetical protein EKM03_11880 [Flavobacterium sp. GSP6]